MLVSSQSKRSLAQAQRYWDLLRVLVKRNLKVRYRGSFLGAYWSLLNPLIMTGLYTAIFGKVFVSYYNDSLPKYILAAFTGLIVVNFFSASTTQALTSVVANGSLLNKVRLPVSIFPVSMLMANAVQFFISSLPLLILVTLITSSNPLLIPLLLVPIFSLMLVCAGIGFLTSALYVFFRDLPYFFELIVFVLWLSSPIFYPAEIVPEQLKPFLVLNPLFPIIVSIRHITVLGELPDFHLLFGSLLSGIIMFGIGWGCFQWWRSQFMDLL
jgi:ABC-type polysaccharide/polyol phosphate export permease